MTTMAKYSGLHRGQSEETIEEIKMVRWRVIQPPFQDSDPGNQLETRSLMFHLGGAACRLGNYRGARRCDRSQELSVRSIIMQIYTRNNSGRCTRNDPPSRPFPYFSLVTERAFRACRLSSKRYARLRVSRERWREGEGGKERERERRRGPYATKDKEDRGGCGRIQKRTTEERRGRGFINKLIVLSGTARARARLRISTSETVYAIGPISIRSAQWLVKQT